MDRWIPGRWRHARRDRHGATVAHHVASGRNGAAGRPRASVSRWPRRSGPPATYVHLDVTSPDEWMAAVATAVDRYDKFDVVVNNAGRIIAEAAGADVDRAGRVMVNSDLTLRGHQEVFVVGDLMSLDGLPGVAQAAIQSGRHAAATIKRRLAGAANSRPFRDRDRGSLDTISRRQHRPAPGCRLPRLAALAPRPSRLADRVQEPRSRARPLDDRLPRPRSRRTAITEQQVFGSQALASSVPGGEVVD
jgi:hypothetical protein